MKLEDIIESFDIRIYYFSACWVPVATNIKYSYQEAYMSSFVLCLGFGVFVCLVFFLCFVLFCFVFCFLFIGLLNFFSSAVLHWSSLRKSCCLKVPSPPFSSQNTCSPYHPLPHRIHPQTPLAYKSRMAWFRLLFYPFKLSYFKYIATIDATTFKNLWTLTTFDYFCEFMNKNIHKKFLEDQQGISVFGRQIVIFLFVL